MPVPVLATANAGSALATDPSNGSVSDPPAGAFSAYNAYGVALSGWRGASVVKPPPPLARTLTSTQSAWPLYGASVKSSDAVTRPALTA